MRYELGDNIRALRKKRNMTQEDLAEKLNVSPQTVSKWENRLTAPDISLLPTLAGLFDTSIDALFSYDLRERDREVERICGEAFQFRATDRVRSREILDEGLRRFPGDPVLLNNYLCTLDPEKENDEIIRRAAELSEMALPEALGDVHLDALRFLAEGYARKGEMAFAKATLERIPEIYFTKLTVAALYLTGEDKFRAADRQKWISLEDLAEMMRELARCYEERGETEKAAAEREKARQLLALFSDGAHPWVAELLEDPE